MKSVFQLLAVAALGVTTLVACPGPNPNPGGTINSFKVKAVATTDAPAEVLALPAGGGSVEFSWQVTGADTVEIDNGVLAPTATLSGTATKAVTATTTFTLTAKKGSGATTKTVSVNVAGGITVNGKVLRFDGTPAQGVVVQIGDATADNRVQVNSDTQGNFTAQGVTVPYTISAVPPNTDIPVSYKNVSTTTPQIILEPKDGLVKVCDREESYIRFRLENTEVQAGNIGYMYFVAEGIHEDSLKSNAVQVMYPGDRSSTVRVRYSNAKCATTVTGSLIYLERANNGYQLAGVIPNVTVSPGQTVPPTTNDPFRMTVSNTGSQQLGGQVTLPTGYTSGFAAPVLKVGNASVFLGDGRDIKLLTTGSGSDNVYGFALPPALNTVKYRVGVFGVGPDHTSWFFSDELANIQSGGVDLPITTPTTHQPQEPGGNIIDNVIPTFAWTATTSGNLYYAGMGNINCNATTWSAVSTGTTSTELTRFRLPRLPTPARLDVGTIAQPCQYTWNPANSIRMRVAADATSDKLLDGRLILKRHFALIQSLPDVSLVFPVRTNGTIVPGGTTYRDEAMAPLLSLGGAVPAPTRNPNSAADNPSAFTPVPGATRTNLNNKFTRLSVGPFNNPDQIADGVVTTLSQQFQTQK
jgi:hypothetical protein